jgi:LAO/AO transport system kinase
VASPDETPTPRSTDVDMLAEGVAGGDRRSLARAITLVESTRLDRSADGAAVLDRVLDRTGSATRVGISGTPGAGKSTFIEALGLHLIGAGHRVAVLAVDPSSTRSGGSILGDKTRMEGLVRAPEAFIRPSPSGGSLGGVARRTREAMLLCEAAGYDVVLVETVGVGQSETAVDDMVDTFCLLVSPGGGDELQGIKRGIMELADLVVVNKADGDLAAAANHAASDYAAALHLLRPKTAAWSARVLLASALEGRGVAEVWEAVEAHRDALAAAGELDRRRAEQARAWLWSEVTDRLTTAFRRDPEVGRLLPELEAEVGAGVRSPTTAALRLLDAFRGIAEA